MNYKYDWCLEMSKFGTFVHMMDESSFLDSWKTLTKVFFSGKKAITGNDGIIRFSRLKLIPFEGKAKFVCDLNEKFTISFGKRMLRVRKKEFLRQVLIVSRPEHQGWIKRFNFHVSLYDVRDSYVHYPNNWKQGAEKYLAYEAALMKAVDAVICVSRPLYERALKENERSYFIPNGIDYDFFAKEVVQETKQSDALLIGSLDERVRFDWILEAARKLPDVKFKIAGPIKTRDENDLKIVGQLKSLENVEFSGEVAFDDFPKVIAKAKVALLPYKVNDWTNATSPIKLFQYLACGKAIVSSRLPQCIEQEDLLYLADDAQSFAHEIKKALAESADAMLLRRQAVAQKSTWQDRAQGWKVVLDDTEARALLVSRTFMPVVGGIETFYHELANGVGKRFCVLTQVHRTSADFDDAQKYEIIRANLRVKEVTTKIGTFLSAKLEEVLVKASICRVVREKNPELIILGDGWLSNLVPWLKKETNKPVAIFFHGKELARMKKFKAQKQLDGLKVADCIYVNSGFTKDLVTSTGYEGGKVVTLYPGVNTDLFREGMDSSLIKKKHGLQGKKVMISISRLAKRKGIQNNIAALKNVLKEHPDLVYVVVGSGPMKDELKQKVSDLGLEGNVVFAGRVPTEELPLYHAAADLFVLPNLYLKESADAEGFGIVFLEAGACGRAVIGGKNGGTSDAVVEGKTGVLVESENIEELSQAISELLSDDERRLQMGLEGAKRAHENFSWNSVKEQFKQCLRN